MNYKKIIEKSKSQIKAEVIAHSVNENGNELITYELTFPRIILPEVLTHRMASRNTSSCLSGDTKVHLTDGSTITMKKLSELWKTDQEKVKSLKLVCYNEKEDIFIETKITNVFDQGKNVLYTVVLEDGRKLVCTENHRILSKEGWITIENAYNPYKDRYLPDLCVEGEKRYLKVLDVFVEREDLTYDLEVDGEFKNFVANGVVVHNSRAIPFEKMYEVVEENPFVPIAFQKHHKGMQGTEYLKEESLSYAVKEWLNSCKTSIESSRKLFYAGTTKQLCNRLLEPFMWTKMIFTISVHEKALFNFFELRISEHAEIHIKELAEKMKLALENSTPNKLQEGQWHIPYEKELQRGVVSYIADRGIPFSSNIYEEIMVKCSVALCARVSYTTIEDDISKNIEKLLELHNRLIRLKHSSPLEHQAKALEVGDERWFDNLIGFQSYRNYLSNKID